MPRPLLCLLVLVACSARAGRAQTPAPRSFQVATAPGVSIEVIDWGGRGRPLVFLAGGGHSAREFEDFAPLFAGEFRVLGISRRGSGGSSDVPPERLDDLVGDVVAVLDSLRLGSAVLIGHSFAGTEMALFGEKHRDRCAGLVYLDAAYDYTDPEVERIFTETPPPQAPPMRSADSASVDAVRAYYRRVSGFSVPESEIRATNRFDAEGRLVGRAPSAVQRQMGALVRAPRWEAVDCPSAGIYAVPAPPETWLHYYGELDAAQREAAAAYYRAFSRWTAKHREAFGRGPRNRVVEFPGSNHYFFLEKPDEAKRIILDFLSGLP